MSEPLPPAGPEVNVSAHTVEMGMTARVITDAQGAPVSMVLTGQFGMEVKAPGNAFPFVKNGHPVLVIVSVVQVSAPDPFVGKPGGIIRAAS
jgi:hypothetical protein